MDHAFRYLMRLLHRRAGSCSPCRKRPLVPSAFVLSALLVGAAIDHWQAGIPGIPYLREQAHNVHTTEGREHGADVPVAAGDPGQSETSQSQAGDAAAEQDQAGEERIDNDATQTGASQMDEDVAI